mmetsp:Transcript_11387/g.12925  ORF Transcript_11387/g.12925 Transcript_11387/m.12925 type:complete len:117 (+) Transcript_11387:3024-3374(+)
MTKLGIHDNDNHSVVSYDEYELRARRQEQAHIHEQEFRRQNQLPNSIKQSIQPRGPEFDNTRFVNQKLQTIKMLRKEISELPDVSQSSVSVPTLQTQPEDDHSEQPPRNRFYARDA